MSQETEAIRWPSIDPEDIDVLEFDFGIYSAGQSAASVAVSVDLMRGAHATPASVLFGAPVISGSKVYQRVHEAVNGAIYKVRARAEFADGRAQVLAGILPCVRR